MTVLWMIFSIMLISMISIDFFVVGHSKAKTISARSALTWTLIWIATALIFNAGVWGYFSTTAGSLVADEKAIEFFTAYLIEKILSVDNLFVFLMIFGYFAVEARAQRRVLLYGVLGAIVLRLLLIFAGLWLVSEMHWILYLFGLFLGLTGLKMLISSKEQPDLEQNLLLRWLRRHLRITPRFEGERFFVRLQGKWHATPLFLVLILIEVSDLIFALDSIPAVFAVTQDALIVVTSNIFAILGLRALYFLLAKMADDFHLLKVGIAIMLIFIGSKMVIAPWVTVSIPVTLSVVATILILSIFLSIWFPPKKEVE